MRHEAVAIGTLFLIASRQRFARRPDASTISDRSAAVGLIKAFSARAA
jgi:hypothetical protein